MDQNLRTPKPRIQTARAPTHAQYHPRKSRATLWTRWALVGTIPPMGEFAASLNHPSGNGRVRESAYWMRSLSFAALHRILKLVAACPDGLRPGHINQLIKTQKAISTPRTSGPAPTTLYHYRNTLLKLTALKRTGPYLSVNLKDPAVRQLLDESAPTHSGQALTDSAKSSFADLVLRNTHCKSIFFDLFYNSAGSLEHPEFALRRTGVPVAWTRHRTPTGSEVMFSSRLILHPVRYTSHNSINATLYGLRYWAKDELTLIDEFTERSGGSAILFPLRRPRAINSDRASVVCMIRHILALRADEEWTMISIADLIRSCCIGRREPISVLFRAVDRIVHTWPNYIILVYTPHGIATLGTKSRQSVNLALRRYYKPRNGPYVSHIRLHKDISISSMGSNVL